MGPVRRGKRHGRQSGMTLVEVLISILVISLILGAATTGIIMLNRTTAAANSAARANLLATGMAEVLKSIEYVECTRGNLEDEYQNLFNQYQQDLPVEKRLLKAYESAVVDDVEVVCSPVDPGVQTISYQVTSAEGLPQEKSRTAEIVKRNPEYVDALFADFQACLLTTLAPPDTVSPLCPDAANVISPRGDAVAIFQLDARASSPIARIVEFAYDCNNGGPIVRTTLPDDPDVACEYSAEATAFTRTIAMTITDTAGRTRTAEQDVTIPAVQDARIAPTARITGTCSPTPSACTAGSNPNLSGTANPNLTVNFSGAGSFSLQGTIVKYEWEFGDVSSGDSNFATGVTASHTFSRSCTCVVRLTVTDDAGKTSSPAEFRVAVTRPGPQPPIAAFTFTPSQSVAPQLVSFNGTGSTAAGGGPVTSYFWTFGDGVGTSTQASPTYRYTNPGTYAVTLTVTAGTLTASTTRNVVIRPFTSIPPGFRMTRSAGFAGLDLFNIFRGYFDFAWQNVPASNGDVVEYEIDMRKVSGFCLASFGQRQIRLRANGNAVQTFRYLPPSPSRICILNTYEWRVRSHRTSPTEGTITSNYTPWVQETVRNAW